jgi:fluoride exporter
VTALFVVAGAMVGAPLRLWVTRVAVRLGREPAIGTLVVNVVGSALLGALTAASGVSAATAALIGAGFCGALTTFSTFGADVLRLVDLRRLLAALAYVMATLLLGIGAAVVTWVLVAGAVAHGEG